MANPRFIENVSISTLNQSPLLNTYLSMYICWWLSWLRYIGVFIKNIVKDNDINILLLVTYSHMYILVFKAFKIVVFIVCQWCPKNGAQISSWKHSDWLILKVCRFGVYRDMLVIKVSLHSMNTLSNDPIVIYWFRVE